MFSHTAQKKEGGRKTVVTMSSVGGCMGLCAEESRDPQEPLGFGDGIFLAYKASKTALNQGKSPAALYTVSCDAPHA